MISLIVAAAAVLLAGPWTCVSAQEVEGPTGAVIGLVYDSTAAEPLAGARVAVMGTSSVAETDSTGQFRIDDVPVGGHMITFFHPRLGELGVGSGSTRVEVRERGVSEVLLAVPSRPTILGAWCSAEEGTGAASIGGNVTDALTGVPLPSARIAVIGGRGGVLLRRQIVTEVRTDNAGDFRICNVDLNEGTTLAAQFGENFAEEIALSTDGAQVVDVVIEISEPVTITGTVLDYATRAPLVGANVSLMGTRFSSVTDTAGKFGIFGVPPGRQVIETELLGYASRIDSLTVFSNEALGLDIVLSTEAIVLEPIVVTGRSRGLDVLTTPGTRFDGLTEAQIDSVIPRVFDFTGLVRAARIPGLSVREVTMANGFGGTQLGMCVETIRSRSGSGGNTCEMVDVRLNDSPVPEPQFFLLGLNPSDIRRMQFISPLEAGMLYGTRGTNGVLLLYTR